MADQTKAELVRAMTHANGGCTVETGLVRLDNVTAVEVFTGGGLDPILARIKAEATREPQSVETSAGRAAIASLAFRVARSKTFLDDLGKTLVAEQKAAIAKVDAERKRCRDELDAIKAAVRAPLDSWEQEQERGKDCISGVLNLPTQCAGLTAEQITDKVRGLAMRPTIPLNLTEAYDAAVHRVEKQLIALAIAAKKSEDDAAELARLRAAAAAQQQADHDEELRRAGEERARKEAERAIAEQAARAEREKLAAIEEERRRNAAEARRVADEQAAKERAERARQENAEHRAAVEREIIDALCDAGLSRDAALIVVALARDGRAGNLTIRY